MCRPVSGRLNQTLSIFSLLLSLLFCLGLSSAHLCSFSKILRLMISFIGANKWKGSLRIHPSLCSRVHEMRDNLMWNLLPPPALYVPSPSFYFLPLLPSHFWSFTNMLKNKQPAVVSIRATMQQQHLASARNRRLAQQMENRPSVQAALNHKQVIWKASLSVFLFVWRDLQFCLICVQ